MRVLAVIVVAALGLAALFGCASKCPPEEPCTVNGVQVFDCGSSQCTTSQLCVVPRGCDTTGDFTSSTARCLDRPAECDGVDGPCYCAMGWQTPYCCYWAGWKPGTGGNCNYACQ